MFVETEIVVSLLWNAFSELGGHKVVTKERSGDMKGDCRCLPAPFLAHIWFNQDIQCGSTIGKAIAEVSLSIEKPEAGLAYNAEC